MDCQLRVRVCTRSSRTTINLGEWARQTFSTRDVLLLFRPATKNVARRMNGTV